MADRPEHQEQRQDHRRDRHELAEVDPHRAALDPRRDRLVDHDRGMPAVERQQREQVEDREHQADAAEQEQQCPDVAGDVLAADVDDADQRAGPFEVTLRAFLGRVGEVLAVLLDARRRDEVCRCPCRTSAVVVPIARTPSTGRGEQADVARTPMPGAIAEEALAALLLGHGVDVDPLAVAHDDERRSRSPPRDSIASFRSSHDVDRRAVDRDEPVARTKPGVGRRTVRRRPGRRWCSALRTAAPVRRSRP